jgi:hypothetical protein
MHRKRLKKKLKRKKSKKAEENKQLANKVKAEEKTTIAKVKQKRN